MRSTHPSRIFPRRVIIPNLDDMVHGNPDPSGPCWPSLDPPDDCDASPVAVCLDPPALPPGAGGNVFPPGRERPHRQHRSPLHPRHPLRLGLGQDHRRAGLGARGVADPLSPGRGPRRTHRLRPRAEHLHARGYRRQGADRKRPSLCGLAVRRRLGPCGNRPPLRRPPLRRAGFGGIRPRRDRPAGAGSAGAERLPRPDPGGPRRRLGQPVEVRTGGGDVLFPHLATGAMGRAGVRGRHPAAGGGQPGQRLHPRRRGRDVALRAGAGRRLRTAAHPPLVVGDRGGGPGAGVFLVRVRRGERARGGAQHLPRRQHLRRQPERRKEPFVADFQIGVAGIYRGIRITLSEIFRTPEFKEQRGSDRFGSLTLSARF